MAVASQPMPVATVTSRTRLSQGTASSSSASASSQLGQLCKLEERVHLHKAKRIGSGSLGVVLLVPDRRSGRNLAVKVISMKLGSDAGNEEVRAWKEVQVMREIEHPNVVRLVDAFACWNRLPHVQSEPPYLCIAMEFIADSDPLSNVLRRSGPSPGLAMQVLPQLANALAEMHSRGLVHRDVWSENVLVNEKGRAVLVDLGCAEYVSSAAAVNSKLNIPYMSPEAARGLQQSPMDDCWALGLLITEMVTGRFVADRLGRSDVPMHFRGNVLADAVVETSAHGGAEMASLCTKLLEPKATQRLTMEDVLTWCGSRAGRVHATTASLASAPAPVATSNGLQASSSLQPPVATNASSFLPAASASKPPMQASHSSGRAMRFGFGQSVLYRPRSHNQLGTATVVGRSGRGQGWQIRLENGALKEIDDTESWRLTAISGSATTGSAPQAPAAQATHAVKVHPAARPAAPVTTSTSVSMSASLPAGIIVPSRQQAVSSVSLAPTAATAPAPVITQSGPGSPKGTVQLSGGSLGTSVAHPVPTGTTISRKPSVLSAGQRVMYTARSNGQRYPGRIIGRLGGYATGWRLALDCGDLKEVTDSDSWRIAPVG